MKLAFATTVHKSQGLSLDQVEVNCKDIFASGHLSVAIGRAKTSTGLRVLGFDPTRHIVPPASKVVEFLHSEGAIFDELLSCCEKKLVGGENGNEGKVDLLQPNLLIDEGEEVEEATEDDLVMILAEMNVRTQYTSEDETANGDLNLFRTKLDTRWI